MNHSILDRRQFLRYSFFVSLFGVTACSNGTKRLTLRTPNQILPKELLRHLPPNWKVENFGMHRNINPYKFLSQKGTDLLALHDGWIDGLPSEALDQVVSAASYQSLSTKAKQFLKLLGSNYEQKVVPIGFSPWVMIFRNGETWIDQARESWEVLLNPQLKGQIILPNSPRLVISLSDQMSGNDQLQALRSQVLTYDDVNALNWILSGKARVAVLPLQRCLGSLIRDQRLSIAFPRNGSPLNWTVLVKPALSQAVISLSWLQDSWSAPSLGKLLSKGWIPPIANSEISKAKTFVREDISSIVLPSQAVWDRCWTLFPLDEIEKKILEKRWINSTP